MPISAPHPGEGLASAHDFVWSHRRAPYDLTVFQLGNAACHDYMWGYLFRYPGARRPARRAAAPGARPGLAQAAGTRGAHDYLAEFAPTIPTRRRTPV